MIINSIDIQAGQTVQLRQGQELILNAGDPLSHMRRFALLGEVAVIDLDAAKGVGSNESLIVPLLNQGDCRVGGGIRSAERAIWWFDRGAAKVIIGTAASREVLAPLPRDRTIVALDARDGDVLVEGWTKSTGARVADRMRELAQWAGGFLATFVETEGTLAGLGVERAQELAVLAQSLGCKLTVAGGVRTAGEIAALDAIGVDAQVGMAVYQGQIDPSLALAACLRSDRPDGLWPTVVCDERGTALGLCYSDARSLAEAYRTGTGVYHSRTRGLWRKGESSGATQELLRIDADCDRDALRFTVRQRPSNDGGGFCHTGSYGCFGKSTGLSRLEQTISRAAGVPAVESKSYTHRLLSDERLLSAKLQEEAAELAAESPGDRVVSEAADLLYFTLVKLASARITLAAVERELDRRSRKLTRRAGDAKPAAKEAP